MFNLQAQIEPSHRGGITDRAAIGLILAAGLAAYGLVVFTDYLLWDGWNYTHWFQIPSQLQYASRAFSEFGRPLDMLFWWPFIGGQDLYAWGKIAGVAAWALSACFMFFALTRTARLNSVVAFQCAIVAVCLPVFDVIGDFCIWMNTASVALFYAAWCLVPGSSPGRRRWLALRVVTLGLFFISFNLNSLLVLFYAFAAVVVFLRNIGGKPEEVARAIFSDLRTHLDFLALPVVFYAAKQIFTPVHGYYIGYNSPTLAPEVLARVTHSLVEGFLWAEIAAAFSSFSWVVVAILLVAGFAIYLKRYPRLFCWGSNGDYKSNGVLMLCGATLLLAAALPYAVVDQSFQSHGWLSRNCILMPLPLSMLIVGLLRLLCAALVPHRPRVIWLLVLLVLCLAIGSANRTTLRWQALGAKQVSFMEKAHKAFADSPPAVVQLRDYFLIPETIYYFAPIVWIYILARDKEEPGTYVIETAQMFPDQIVQGANGEMLRQPVVANFSKEDVRRAIEETKMPYAMTQIPTHGSQALLLLMPGQLGSDGVSIGWQYLLRKWLRPGELPDFLDKVTALEVIQLPAIPDGSA